MKLPWLPQKTSRALKQLDLSFSVPIVPEIDQLLSKTVLFRGKKLRPTLLLLMGQLFQVSPDKLLPYARAAELVHSATLAHDDVIDESPLRRRRPTLNVRASNSRAILVGDLLLARVMSELSKLGEIALIHDLAMTIEDLVMGEWLQLEARQVICVDRFHLEVVARKKTASLIAWCCSTPVRLAGLSETIRDAAFQFGELLGVAFQMIDDVIDYDTSGDKPFAQDFKEGLINFVSLEILEANPHLKQKIQENLGCVQDIIHWPWTHSELMLACDQVRVRSQLKLENADQILYRISKEFKNLDFEALQALKSILLYLKERIR